MLKKYLKSGLPLRLLFQSMNSKSPQRFLGLDHYTIHLKSSKQLLKSSSLICLALKHLVAWPCFGFKASSAASPSVPVCSISLWPPTWQSFSPFFAFSQTLPGEAWVVWPQLGARLPGLTQPLPLPKGFKVLYVLISLSSKCAKQ